MQSAPIQSQVRLPLSVAFGVVLQGIRIRLGRSLVTLLGVVLGIAFLMSILTAQLARQSVRQEQALRTELQRQLSFLTAESGPLAGRTVALLPLGPLTPVESRLVATLARERPAQLRWGGTVPPPAAAAAAVTLVPAADLGRDAVAVVVLGGTPPPGFDWRTLVPDARRGVLAFTREPPAGLPAGLAAVSLARELRPEDRAAAAAEARRARFRLGWIVAISLLVTVIGITNSLLMSVTERFREIGTMKCLGALSAFIRHLFLIESSLMGLVGAFAGTVLGALFAIALYGFTFGFGSVLGSLPVGWLAIDALGCIVAGTVLSVLAGLYPASFAARMVPATALRTSV